ncbi:MAG: hypothetical protein WBG86_20645 [Polyangiales bacterium]
MRVYAYMTAFTGRDGEPVTIRPIEIPSYALEVEHTLEDDEYPATILNAAFKYGQNDFQPRRCPSLSVGDVIEVPMPVDSDEDVTYWSVEAIGFKKRALAPLPENGTEQLVPCSKTDCEYAARTDEPDALCVSCEQSAGR